MIEKSLYLATPTIDDEEAFLAYVNEFVEHKADLYGGLGIMEMSYIKWLAQLEKDRYKNLPPPYDVPFEIYFLKDKSENTLIGNVYIRKELNTFLLNNRGHIGHSIRPTMQNKGYGKEMLRLTLEKCKNFGIEKVLLMCEADNMPSEKVILYNNGVLDKIEKDDRGRIQKHFWISVL